MNRREFVGGLAGLAVLSTTSLKAALAGGTKTLVIGASRRGCELALAQPGEVILADRGILPAIELGPAETDIWSKKLVDAKCRVLLNMEVEKVEKTDAGFRVTAYGSDGLHEFEVSRVIDATVDGWHKGEFHETVRA